MNAGLEAKWFIRGMTIKEISNKYCPQKEVKKLIKKYYKQIKKEVEELEKLGVKKF